MATGNADVLYDLLQPSVQQKEQIEDRAAKDAEAVVNKKPAPEKPKPKPPPAAREEEVSEDEPMSSGDEGFVVKDDEEEEAPAKPKAKAPPKPKKKKTKADETKKKATATKRPLTGAAAASSAKKKKQQDTAPQPSSSATTAAAAAVNRHPPGFSMVKAERDRIDRALTALKRRVATRADKDKEKGKKPTTTVCSILNASLIKFYSKIRGEFETEFSEYLEAEDKNQDN